MLLRGGPSKPSARAVCLAVERQRGARRARPRRAGSARGARRRSREALGVAAEHLDEGEPVVREPHRLRALQVRVAGQHRVEVLARARDQHAAQLEQPVRESRATRRAGRAPGRSRPGRCGCGRCGAAPPPRRSARAAASRRSCGCLRDAGRAGSVPASISPSDRLETRRRCASASACGDHARAAEHARVGDRAADVVAGQRAIEVDRRGEALDGGVGAFAEAAAPGFVAGSYRAQISESP